MVAACLTVIAGWRSCGRCFSLWAEQAISTIAAVLVCETLFTIITTMSRVTHGLEAFGTNGGELKSNVVVTTITNVASIVVISDFTYQSEIQNVGFVLDALALRAWYRWIVADAPVIITTIAIVSTIFKLIFIAITAL